MLEPAEFVALWKNNGFARMNPKHAKHWGSDELITYSADIDNFLSIPEASRRFLVEAGLPANACTHYSFTIGSSSLQTMPELLSERVVQTDYQRYRIIGLRCFDAPPEWTIKRVIMDFICLDEEDNGRVVVIENSPELTVTYLNGSVQQLAEFFLILRTSIEYCCTHKLKLDEEIEEHYKRTLQNLRDIDPEAVQSGMGWYNPTILYLELGL